MPTCYVFVDGQYVRSELRQAGGDDEFDPSKPARLVRNELLANRRFIPVRVFYYDAMPDEATPEERERQEAYFARLRALPDTHVVLGEVRRGAKKRREQKGVDVQLAVDSLRMAMARVTDAIGLVTGDADFAPLVRAIRETGVHVIVLAFPTSLAQSLADEADRRVHFPVLPTDWGLSDA